MARGGVYISFIFLRVYRLRFFILCGVLSDAGNNRLRAMSLNSSNYLRGIIGMAALFSISGVPPFLGFYAKVRVLRVVLSYGGALLLGILLWGAVIYVFVYIRAILCWVNGETLRTL